MTQKCDFVDFVVIIDVCYNHIFLHNSHFDNSIMQDDHTNTNDNLSVKKKIISMTSKWLKYIDHFDHLIVSLTNVHILALPGKITRVYD